MIFREERGRERKNHWSADSFIPPSGDQAYNLGMCLGWESVTSSFIALSYTSQAHQYFYISFHFSIYVSNHFFPLNELKQLWVLWVLATYHCLRYCKQWCNEYLLEYCFKQIGLIPGNRIFCHRDMDVLNFKTWFT